jgi:hypothetical protein
LIFSVSTFFSSRPKLSRPALVLAAVLLASARLPAQITPAGGNSSSQPASASGSAAAVPFYSTAARPSSAPAPAAGSATAPDIHDLHSLAPLTFWERHGTEVIVYGLLGATLLAVGLWFFLHKKPVPPLTPYERAMRELQFARGLRDTGQDKVFAIAASDAVRHYLENAYQMPAPERTTEEFLQVAASHAWLHGELTTLLRRFLEFCDLAKFAGQQFGAEEREQLLNAAREFIEAAEKLRQPPTAPTKPNPAAAAAAPTPPQPTLSAP